MPLNKETKSNHHYMINYLSVTASQRNSDKIFPSLISKFLFSFIFHFDFFYDWFLF